MSVILEIAIVLRIAEVLRMDKTHLAIIIIMMEAIVHHHLIAITDAVTVVVITTIIVVTHMVDVVRVDVLEVITPVEIRGLGADLMCRDVNTQEITVRVTRRVTIIAPRHEAMMNILEDHRLEIDRFIVPEKTMVALAL